MRNSWGSLSVSNQRPAKPVRCIALLAASVSSILNNLVDVLLRPRRLEEALVGECWICRLASYGSSDYLARSAD